jgi:hypothetical protein
MSLTPYLSWVFPAIGTADGHAQRLTINKGKLGYNPVASGVITASQQIVLDPAFLPLDLGEWERAQHDIGAVPVVPKIEFTLNDVYVFSGESNSVPVDWDLSGDLSSLLDEIFYDPLLNYEVWIDDIYAGTVFEVWFCGDVDNNTIPFVHKTVVGEGTDAATRQQEATITANFIVERLTANTQKNYVLGDAAHLNNGNPTVITPGSVYDMIYNFFVGGHLPMWEQYGGNPIDTHNHPIWAGSSCPAPIQSTFGNTGPPSTGMVLAVGPASEGPPATPNWQVGFWNGGNNIVNVSLTDIAKLIALYGNLSGANFDPNMMFDLYSQGISDPANASANWPLTLRAATSIFGGWSNIFVNANSLFGSGIPITNAWTGNGVHFKGQDGYGGSYDFHASTSSAYLTGAKFYDYNNSNVIAFNGNVSGTSIQFQTCNPFTFVTSQNQYGDQVNTFNGTIGPAVGGVAPVVMTGTIGGAICTLFGTQTAGTPNVYEFWGAAPLINQWPCTIDPSKDVLSLVAWLCTQTGTWIDSSIDISGNVTMEYRSRRAPLGTYFQGTNLKSGEILLISSSSQEPSEITASGVTVQVNGDSVVMLCGPDPSNVVAITTPFACHKFGEYVTRDGNVFFCPNNNVRMTVEQWWNKSYENPSINFLGEWGSQGFCVSADAHLDNRYYNSRPSGFAIPTVDGYSAGNMLLWYNEGAVQLFPDGEINQPPAGGTNYSFSPIAAILPAGVPLPLDEMCGGYFNPQTAYAQVYFQELISKDGRIILQQDCIGCRGDDGYIQSLRPGLLWQTYIRNKFRTFILHNVKQKVTADTCALQWIEVPLDGLGNINYNNLLPSVSQVGGGSTSAPGFPSGGTGGGGTSTPATVTLNITISSNVDNYIIPGIQPSLIVFITVAGTDPQTWRMSGLAGGTNGMRITLTNTSTGILALSNMDVLSDAQNQFYTVPGTELKLMPGMTQDLLYNSTMQKWTLPGFNGFSS